MNATHPSPNESDLRLKIGQLRRELEQTAKDLDDARTDQDAGRSIDLLLRRSNLTRELFDVQSALMELFRAAAFSEEPHPSAAVAC